MAIERIKRANGNKYATAAPLPAEQIAINTVT
jgi:hypothetical protein